MTALLELCERLGGSRSWPEKLRASPYFHVALGLWWVILFGLALAFSGSDIKFIYIDF